MRRLRGCPSIGFIVGSVPQKLAGKPCSNSWTESILAISSAVSLRSIALMLSCRCCGQALLSTAISSPGVRHSYLDLAASHERDDVRGLQSEAGQSATFLTRRS